MAQKLPQDPGLQEPILNVRALCPQVHWRDGVTEATQLSHPSPYIGSSTRGRHPFPAGLPPPTQPLLWIGGNWPQLLPRQPLKPESGSPRVYCVLRAPSRTHPAPSSPNPAALARRPLWGRTHKGLQDHRPTQALEFPAPAPVPLQAPGPASALAHSTLGRLQSGRHGKPAANQGLGPAGEELALPPTPPPLLCWGGLAS